MRAVIYARYSSHNQREASIEDQVRLCRTQIVQEGWVYLHAYTDRGLERCIDIATGLSRSPPGRPGRRLRCCRCRIP